MRPRRGGAAGRRTARSAPRPEDVATVRRSRARPLQPDAARPGRRVSRPSRLPPDRGGLGRGPRRHGGPCRCRVPPCVPLPPLGRSHRRGSSRGRRDRDRGRPRDWVRRLRPRHEARDRAGRARPGHRPECPLGGVRTGRLAAAPAFLRPRHIRPGPRDPVPRPLGAVRHGNTRRVARPARAGRRAGGEPGSVTAGCCRRRGWGERAHPRDPLQGRPRAGRTRGGRARHAGRGRLTNARPARGCASRSVEAGRRRHPLPQRDRRAHRRGRPGTLARPVPRRARPRFPERGRPPRPGSRDCAGARRRGQPAIGGGCGHRRNVHGGPTARGRGRCRGSGPRGRSRGEPCRAARPGPIRGRQCSAGGRAALSPGVRGTRRPRPL